MPAKMIWTIGHSNRGFEEFIDILKSFGISMVADIRGLPGSRKYPHFNKENLEKSLPENSIGYVHIPDLGGRRKGKKDSVNDAWNQPAFRAYADYMETESFRHGAEVLMDIASQDRTAFMCAEVLWWSCHRSLVSDYLKLRGWNVNHIMDAGKSVEHPYTSPARIVSGQLSYKKE